MVRDYELMYIVRPDLDEDGLHAAMDTVQNLVTGQGGEVLKVTPWGKRRLAYEIQRLRDGNYVLCALRLDTSRVKEINRALRISDNVIRHLITADVVGKWATENGRGEAEAGIPGEETLGGGGEAPGSPAGELDGGLEQDEDLDRFSDEEEA